jgi:hypothetical protein
MWNDTSLNATEESVYNAPMLFSDEAYWELFKAVQNAMEPGNENVATVHAIGQAYLNAVREHVQKEFNQKGK